jgi:hypothetical protein
MLTAFSGQFSLEEKDLQLQGFFSLPSSVFLTCLNAFNRYLPNNLL